MEPMFWSVVDTTVKIGLGSIITAVSGYLVLRQNHTHENEKELRKYFYKQQNEKKLKYVEFLSQSQTLVQSYLRKSCTCDTDDYKKYLRSFNEVQIISEDHIRITANELQSVVSQFIIANKNSFDPYDAKIYRQNVNEKVGIFQKIAQLEVTKSNQKT